MLRTLLATHRDELLSRAHQRVVERNASLPVDLESTRRLAEFFDQIQGALKGSDGPERFDHVEVERSASALGRALFQEGFTVAEVVHEYGDLCRVITASALEENGLFSNADLQMLHVCLEDAVTGAVTEYERQCERSLAQESSERAGVLAHEMRNYLNTAMLALSNLTSGAVGTRGATSGILQRSLSGLHTLVERSFASVRSEVASGARERVVLREVIEEVVGGAALLAKVRGLSLVVKSSDDAASVLADRQLLAAAVTNLVQNAFKFTRPGTRVMLGVNRQGGRVCIDVEDECGGLPPGPKENLVKPFVQLGRDRTGLGLGLSICVEAMRAMDGELRVRDLPGKGCVFSLDLPRLPAVPSGVLTLPLLGRLVKQAAAQ